MSSRAPAILSSWLSLAKTMSQRKSGSNKSQDFSARTLRLGSDITVQFAKLLNNVLKTFYTQVSKCGKAGCKEEPLAAEEEEQALTFENIFYE